CDIVLSEHTYELCQNLIWVRELDRIRVKGKMQPVNLYELIDKKDAPLNPHTREFLDLYGAARSAYTGMRFEEAMRLFEQANRLRPGDRAVAVHISRAKDYLSSPPPNNWDGVHIMTTK
ncbi:MAG TPA: adenylate/guanylate cyclase domain-containing protein, partial [Trichocoleus sp.]